LNQKIGPEHKPRAIKKRNIGKDENQLSFGGWLVVARRPISSLKKTLQGLKPGSFSGLFGPTKVVPCYKATARWTL
jgi:hypothetical protein